MLMQEHGVAVKESRGRLSYCPPNRVKFITAKKLNKKFEKEQVLTALAQNIRLAPTIQPVATNKPDKVQKLVDIQAKLKQGKGIGYEHWAKKHNLKAMSHQTFLHRCVFHVPCGKFCCMHASDFRSERGRHTG